MGAYREEMREARGLLHEYMSVPAVYFKSPYDPDKTVVKETTVRVHEKFLALGDLKGTNFNYAEMESIAPRLILLREDIPNPQRGYIISIEPGEAYQLDHIQEPDDLTITALVIKLSPKEAAGFPLPGQP